MTYGQLGAVCPQCGSAAAVHSVEELAAMARAQLGEYSPGYAAPPPGDPGQPWPGPPPGYTGQARPPGRPSRGWEGSGDGSSFEDEIAGAVLGAATRFIGRAIGRRVKRTYNERVVPTLAARQEEMLREQIAIAERHPDLRACLTDEVIFLVGGSRVLPMASVTRGITLEQADALVAGLRDG